MEPGSEDPLIVASSKYSKVLEYAQNVAAAADFHPEIAFDQSSTPYIGNKEVDYVDEDEALADVRTNALMLSKAWEDAQNYFEGAFRDEFLGYHSRKGIDKEKDEAYHELAEKMKVTEMELWNLDSALSHVLESPPSEDQCKVKFEAGSDQENDLPDKGDFF